LLRNVTHKLQSHAKTVAKALPILLLVASSLWSANVPEQDWNIVWPSSGKTFYNIDFDFKIGGTLPSIFVHSVHDLERGAIYLGPQTDDSGKPKQVLFTLWLAKGVMNAKTYSMPKTMPKDVDCRLDDRKEESADGYVSCFYTFEWKKDTWYRLRVWNTGNATAMDGKTQVKEWGAWIIELDGPGGKTIKEYPIARLGADTGMLTGVRYSASEAFNLPATGRCEQVKAKWKGNVSIAFPRFNNQSITSRGPSNGMVVDAVCNIRGKVNNGIVTVPYPQ
jgi:hypothetical protein